MSVRSWKIRDRKFWRGRENDADYVKLDLTKDPQDNIIDILSNICAPTTLSEVKLLNYINNYVKLISQASFNFSQTDFKIDELFCCLRTTCVHESTLIRTAGLRAIRYSVKTSEHVQLINKLQIPFLIARSFDLTLANDIERVQALKLIRRLLLISPTDFDISLGRALVALANGAHEEKDRMLRACLAALSEFGILNSKLFIQIGGVMAIIRNILECQTPHIAESLCGTLLHLMNHPSTRDMAAIDLQCLAAPYCDFHLRRTSASNSEMVEERELRFNCSRLALLSVLRSWPGIFNFCNPTNPNCLKAMVEILYLEHLEVKNAVLDLLYELLNLPQPEWTDEFSVALNAVDPADAQDSWRLRDGFVAAEARSLLPHLSRTTPNLAEIHLSVLLYTFIEIGLLTALAEVIVTGDTFICVRATILLGVLLHWAHQLLPPDCCNITPPLPNLIMDATNKYQALSAVAALQDLHTMLKERPASSSLFLDHILMSSSYFKSSTINRNITVNKQGKSSSLSSRNKFLQTLVSKDSENLLRDSAVLQQKDGYTWDWDIIRTILKDNVDMIQKVDESNYKAFIKRLVHYFKPSSNRFSHTDLSSKHAQKYTLAGCDLIEFLLGIINQDGDKLLIELFKDISVQIDAISTSKSAHDCLFSPQHMSNTCCQMYFLFIGKMTHSMAGLDILTTKTDISQLLLKLATSTNHDCYVKLIISSMDYTMDAFPRKILSETLTCELKGSRLYSTQFLQVLLRAKVYQFERWGVELLVTQLYDQSKAISLTALNILHEACEERVYLDKLVNLKPDLINLGDKGLLLLIRFLSTQNGFTFLQQTNFVTNEINRWITSFNYRYVRIVEEELHDSLTLHQRNEDGHYNRRISSSKTVFRKHIFVPPHLYGQLVQYTKGYNMLVEMGNLNLLFKCIEKSACGCEQEVMELKAALWACGNLAISSLGVDLLASNHVFASTIAVAKSCSVYSVRGTAVYVLGVMSTTFKGANELFKLGWACTRHDRHELWPVIEGENWELDSVSPHGCWSYWQRSDKESESSDRISENSSIQFCWPDDQLAKNLANSSLPDVDGSVTDDELFLNIDAIENAAKKKSQTLPSSSVNHPSNYGQHQRSLSESKTADVLSNIENVQSFLHTPKMNTYGNKFLSNRHRDCSESSTSGVSSDDSVIGKYTIGERVQTLSPIPSSSSLSTLKPSFYQQHRGRPEIGRRVYTISDNTMMSTISPTESTRLSHQDLLGYVALRTLRHRTKSSYLNSSEDEISTVVSGGSDNKMKISVSRSLKDRADSSHHTQLSLTDLESTNFPNPILTGGSLSSQTSILKRTSLRYLNRVDGPCYMGICLPRKILDIFPNTSINYKNRFKLLSDQNSNSLPVGDASGRLVINSQISNKSIHERQQCLACCHLKSERENQILPDLFSSNTSRTAGTPGTTQKSILNNSPPPDIQESRLKIDILRHVERLSNPVFYKQSRQVLLHLKQKHPFLFQDICLYSEACVIISSVSMRLTARRFLQELFQDLNFESFYLEPNEILSEKRSNLKKKLKQSTSKDEEDVESSAESPKIVKVEDNVKVRFFNSDAAQRNAELSGLLQPRRETANKIIIASTSNTNVTKGFIITSDDGKTGVEEEQSPHQSVSIKNFGPIRSPPLASVKEETLSSVENLLNMEKSCSPSSPSSPTETTDLIEIEKVTSPRGQKTLVDSLCLTCSQNKFPITTRYQDHGNNFTTSYSFTNQKNSTSKTTSDQISAPQIVTSNNYKNCISSNKSVPMIPPTESHKPKAK